jgi:hypothetical protein
MKIQSVFAAALLMAAPALASAQTFTWLQDINIGGIEGLPSGIVAVGGDAYVAGFANRRIVKIANVTTSAPVSTNFAGTDDSDDAVNGTDWAANTGLVSIDHRAGELMVAGDTFGPLNDGMIYHFNATTGAFIRKQAPGLDGGSGIRIAGAAYYGPSNILAQFQAGTNYFQMNSTLTSAGFYGGPAPVNSRDVAVDQVTGIAYISYNNGTTAGIHRIIDGGTAFDIAGNTNEPAWYSTTMTLAGGTLQGIGLGTIGGTQYAFLALRDDADIHVVATTAAGTAAGAAQVINATQLVRPADVSLATVGPNQYLLVSQYGGAGNIVSVFGVNGAVLGTSVSDWTSY